MDKLKNDFLPKVKVFTEEIAAFRYNYQEMKRIIRQFDNSMSTKANKVELNLFRKEIEESFISIKRLD